MGYKPLSPESELFAVPTQPQQHVPDVSFVAFSEFEALVLQQYLNKTQRL